MLGEKIREIRLSKDLKLSDLAEKTGLSTSYISLLERNLTSPSIASLRKISEVLGIPLFHFLIEENKNTLVTRKEDRKKLLLPKSNIVHEYVTPIPLENSIKPKLEVVYTEVAPDTWSSSESISHKAEECLFILQGEVKVQVGSEVYELSEGDSIYIGEMIPHRYYNQGKQKAKLICALTPPVF